ncbi:MAG: glycerophosphodiester phosphodiesterase family protein [Rhodospirillaceae bacterium]
MSLSTPRLSHLPRLIGHRGAAAIAPENTLGAFRAAAHAGLKMVEYDVKLSADGIPVVIHDDSLERTTTGTGAVRDWLAADLAGLDASIPILDWPEREPVPTLVAVLDLLDAAGMGSNIEIKPCPGREAETAEVVADLVAHRHRRPTDPGNPVVFSSFALESLTALRRQDPNAVLGLLLEPPSADDLARETLPVEAWYVLLRELNAASLHLSAQACRPQIVDAVHKTGTAILAWTVNQPKHCTALWERGVDAIITDLPEEIQLLGEDMFQTRRLEQGI